tara:strand:+ start:960 stop:2414 length:1455 start_codon:yes stop_codon:yes gene_type:complete
MSINVHGSTTQSATGLVYYSFDVIDNKTGDVIESRSYVNKAKAKEYFDKQKKANPDGNFNGEPIKDVTTEKGGSFDDAFVDQADTSGEKFQAITGVTKYDKYGNPIPGSAPTETISVKNIGVNNPNLKAFGTNDGNKNPITTEKLNTLARNYCGLPEEEKNVIISLPPEELEEKCGGTFGDRRIQARITRKNYPSELVLGRGPDNNAFIVLGNDRTSNLSNPGCGEMGHTQCDSIDLVAGLGGFCAQENEKVTAVDPVSGKEIIIESPVETNPNFFVDAARIYVAQKTNCDKNFAIGEFGSARKGMPPSETNPKNIGKYGGKSAVIAKADNIRLIGRESIKIVTGTDAFNSVGGKISGKHGIELIAMNKEEDLQPLVKGNNLALALEIIINNVEAIAEIFQAYVDYQMKFNASLSHHTHITTFDAGRTLESEKAVVAGIQSDIDVMTSTQLSIVKQVTNLQGIKTNFISPSGDAYIMSRLNKTN